MNDDIRPGSPLKARRAAAGTTVRTARRLVKLLFSLLARGADMIGDGARRLFGRPVPARGVVLYYHAIKAHQRARFARQMDHLVRCARPFRAESAGGLSEPGFHAAVTFDDGFVSVIENAVPELKRRNIPFTVFVPTGSLGRRPSWIRDAAHGSWEERVMSPDQLRALGQEPLATIGAHSVSHCNFLKLSPAEAVEEFTQSKVALETLLERDVQLFSYPHGARNDRLDEQAGEAGYERVFTIHPARITPGVRSYALGRVLADPEDWGIEFRLKLTGAYSWAAAVTGVKNYFRISLL
jgi:peptidoglycan/xylan/chitin deacetylase (PgdA/CDA1 family)